MVSKLGTLVLVLLLPNGGRKQAAEPSYAGHPVSYWIAALESSDVEESVRASTMLAVMRGEAVPYLIEAIKAGGSTQRVRLLNTLGWISSAAKPALPLLTELLDDPSPEVRVAAAVAMISVDCGRRASVVPRLIAGLKEDSATAAAAARAIGSLRGEGAPGVPSLVTLLGGHDEALRLEAARTLWKIGPAAKEAIPALEEAARSGGALAQAAKTALEAIRGGGGIQGTPCSERESPPQD